MLCMEYDLHGYGRRLERALDLLPKAGIHPADQDVIVRFHKNCFSDGLSTPRVEKYVRHLITLAKWTRVPFGQATEADVRRILGLIQQSHYADWTKHDLRLSLKKLYQWLRQTGRSDVDVSWLKVGTVKKRHLPRDLPTPEDVQSMIRATKSHRNKSFIMLIYETGARIGEIARLRVRDVVPHPHGLEVHLPVEGKRGARRVLAVASAPYVKAWLNEHPRGNCPTASLWPARARGGTPRYAAFAAIIRRAAKAADVTKKVNPHNFRHSRATHLATHLTEAQMNQFFGWVQGSDMPSTYVHLSGRDVDSALLRSYGIETDKQDVSGGKLAPRTCTQCKSQNPATNSFCGLCGLPLDPEAAQSALKRDLERSRADDAMDRLIQDKEFREMLKRKLSDISLRKPRN